MVFLSHELYLFLLSGDKINFLKLIYGRFHKLPFFMYIIYYGQFNY